MCFWLNPALCVTKSVCIEWPDWLNTQHMVPITSCMSMHTAPTLVCQQGIQLPCEISAQVTCALQVAACSASNSASSASYHAHMQGILDNMHANVLAHLASPLSSAQSAAPGIAYSAFCTAATAASCKPGSSGLAWWRRVIQPPAKDLPECFILQALTELSAAHRVELPIPDELPLDLPAGLLDMHSGDAWAVKLVSVLLTRAPLATLPVAAYSTAARHSVSLSRALLPLLLATAATHVLPASPQGEAEESHALCQELSALASKRILPATADAAAALLSGAMPLQTAQSISPYARGGQDVCASNRRGGLAGAKPPFTRARLEAITLLLQCLAVLRNCFVAARRTKGVTHDHKRGTPAEVVQARHVLSWASECWLDIDYLQVIPFRFLSVFISVLCMR
jgi:hypothetical protein